MAERSKDWDQAWWCNPFVTKTAKRHISQGERDFHLIFVKEATTEGFDLSRLGDPNDWDGIWSRRPLRLSYHLEERMRQRQITAREVIETILSPQEKKKSNNQSAILYRREGVVVCIRYHPNCVKVLTAWKGGFTKHTQEIK